MQKIIVTANKTLQPTPVGALGCISHLSAGVAELGR
jgi:hypothetical protein